ncbi:uncharacterized protein LOC112564564 isoform X2 [Pomacea canaliculata]|uniref:uncharacterized protein LOC112564564 isoform X2 n=1 Tax=Pomacea canaliculata TaxID=400727 RepID=UPI000D72E409|nr:uncharacterized protein LOC112564564 isoform X2 [Pomacea canaliculata]
MKRTKRSSTRSEKVPSSQPASTSFHKKCKTHLTYLPLTGKSVYLDVKDSQQAKVLEMKLKRLGAKVEDFLSKDINYVISHSAPVRSQSKCQKEGYGPESPAFVNTPSPFSAVPSPTSTVASARIIPMTRGKTMAQIACANRSPSPNSVASNAEKLGIKVVTSEAALKWLDKEMAKLGDALEQTAQDSEAKKKRSVAKRSQQLQEPYIKVEPVDMHHRPVYLNLNKWPRLNVNTPPCTCPFDGHGVTFIQRSGRGDRDGKASIGNWPLPPSQQGASKQKEESLRLIGVPIVTAGDLRKQREQKKQTHRRRGFCECCNTRYEDMKEHVKDRAHVDFVSDKHNYEKLDEVISQGPSIADFLQSVLLSHCQLQAANRPVSISSANSESELTTESGTFLKMGHQTVTAKQIGRAQDDICNNPPAVLIADDDCHNYKAKDWERGHIPRTGNCIVNSRTQEQVSCGATHGTTTDRLPLAAVVIRRPGAKAAYGSPVKVRTEASRNPELWSRDLRPVKERSLVFGNSPLGCLQAVVEDKGRNQGLLSGKGNSEQSKEGVLSVLPAGLITGRVCVSSFSATCDEVRGIVNSADSSPLELRNNLNQKPASQRRDKRSGNVLSKRSTSQKLGSSTDLQTGAMLPEENGWCHHKSENDSHKADKEHVMIKEGGLDFVEDARHTELLLQNSYKRSEVEHSERKPHVMTKMTPENCGAQDQDHEISSNICSVTEHTAESLDWAQSPPHFVASPWSKTCRKRKLSHSPQFKSCTWERSNLQTPEKQMKKASVDDHRVSPVFPRSQVHCSMPIFVHMKESSNAKCKIYVGEEDTAESDEINVLGSMHDITAHTNSPCHQANSPDNVVLVEKEGSINEEAIFSGQAVNGNIERCCVRELSDCKTDLEKVKVFQKVDFGLENRSEESGIEKHFSTHQISRDKQDSENGGLSRAKEKVVPLTRTASVSKVSALSSAKKVKLNGSWQLLSDRSLCRLLESEVDAPPFLGFTGDDDGLSSDLTYVEASEFEVSDTEEYEWVFDEIPQGLPVDTSKAVGVETFNYFLPTLSSPDKASDSSWEDACNLYLSESVNKKLFISNKSSATSPSSKGCRKVQRQIKNHISHKAVVQSPDKPHLTVPLDGHTPTKLRKDPNTKSSRKGKGIERVDAEILFNYSSPHRNNIVFSPLQVISGNIVRSSLDLSEQTQEGSHRLLPRRRRLDWS